MKMNKYIQLVKKTHICHIITSKDENEMYLGLPQAIYPAEDLPRFSGRIEIKAMLDMTEKEFDKIHFFEERFPISDMEGLNLEDTEPGETEAEPMDIMVQRSTWNLAAVEARDELFFYDRRLIQPIEKEMQSEEGYIRYFLRTRKDKKDRYLIIKNGFKVIAAILPVKILSDEYLSDLNDFLFACKSQYEREKTLKEAQRTVEELEGQMSIKEDTDI